MLLTKETEGFEKEMKSLSIKTFVLVAGSLMFASIASFAQKQNNIWYFGEYAGVTFNSGVPIVLTNGVMFQNEGSAVMCDNNGNLLFFTDGVSVWNRNLVKMPNGTGLRGNSSTTQSALIVPQPGNCNIYYIFTAPAEDTIIPLCYNIVDLTLDGGLGDISLKNIPLYTPVTERLTGTLQSNGEDYWVVSMSYGSNGFLAFSVTSTGVNTTPLISYSGPLINAANGGISDVLGYMKISPDGSKLCYANSGYIGSYSQLFDFNNTTGVVSNNIQLVDSMGYGVEFSPDNSKVYIETGEPYIITQYDLSDISSAAIQHSATQIVNKFYNPDSTKVYYGGALELGPDNKIYSDRLQENILSVIDQPNLAGAACNFSDTGIILSDKCQDGLPNNIKILGSDCLLPVELLNFTYTLVNRTVELKWQTAEEISSDYFLIEHSADGVNFTAIGKVAAAGNSGSLKEYGFVDEEPLAVNYYRLKEVDFNGHFMYSDVLLVKMVGGTALNIIQNPVGNSLEVEVNGSSQTNELVIYDFSGRRLKTVNVGNGVQRVDVSSFPAGSYLVEMVEGDGEVARRRFVKE